MRGMSLQRKIPINMKFGLGEWLCGNNTEGPTSRQSPLPVDLRKLPTSTFVTRSRVAKVDVGFAHHTEHYSSEKLYFLLLNKNIFCKAFTIMFDIVHCKWYLIVNTFGQFTPLFTGHSGLRTTPAL